MIKTKITLIHNFDEARNNRVAESATQFVNSVKGFSVTTRDGIGWQAPLIHPPIQSILFKELLILKNIASWKAYINFRLFSFSGALNALAESFGRIRNSSQNWPAFKRKCSIETELTIKHKNAWERFLDSEADWLLVLEDDAIYDPMTISTSQQIEEIVGSTSPFNACFISLSVPFTMKELGIERLVDSTNLGVLKLLRPSTNTAAAYLINRGLAEMLVIECRTICGFRLLPADLLLNQLFMQLTKAGKEVTSFHPKQSIFTNGSLSGDYESSVR